jgi:ABC-type amino acid transport substrate-binding protein
VKSQRARALLLSALVAGGFAAAGAFAAPLRVGTSGDYPPFSLETDPSRADLEGFDIALARAYAKARGRRIEFVKFSWPHLNRGLISDHFDLAMSGVTVRPNGRGHRCTPQRSIPEDRRSESSAGEDRRKRGRSPRTRRL